MSHDIGDEGMQYLAHIPNTRLSLAINLLGAVFFHDSVVWGVGRSSGRVERSPPPSESLDIRLVGLSLQASKDTVDDGHDIGSSVPKISADDGLHELVGLIVEKGYDHHV